MKLLKTKQFWLGSIVSLLCLWLALRNVPLTELTQLLTTANSKWLLLALLLQLLAIVVRSQRWVILLNLKRRLVTSFWAQGIGYLFTNVFPFRLGELARILVMSERCQLPIVQVAASAVVERLLDVAVIILLLVLVLPWMQVPALVLQAGISFGLITLMALVLAVLAVRFNHYSENIIIKICTRVPRLPERTVLARWQELVLGLTPLSQVKTGLSVLAWSLLTWGLSIGVYWSVIQAFQSNGTIMEAAFMLVALALAVAVPSSPGFIGVFQYIGQQALVLPFGDKYSLTTALAITLTAHLIYYIFTTLVGLVGLWQLGQSFAELGRSVRSKALPDGNKPVLL